MRRSTRRVAAAITGAAVIATGSMAYLGRYELREEYLKSQMSDRGYNAAVMEKALMIAGGNPAEVAKESKEAATLAEQFAQARTAPSGVVDSEAYTNAYNELTKLGSTGSQWSEVTKVPYNADDPRYRDWWSNSSGGAGMVTGRITGLAADPGGEYVYAAGADGGVWRTSNGDVAPAGGTTTATKQFAAPGWTPIADQLPSLSSGQLELAKDGSLWFATGEANTGGTSYVGAGVYQLENPTKGMFTPETKVGGRELNSSTIRRVRSGGDNTVWVATNRGIWYHDSHAEKSDPWTFAYAPNMDYMPKITDDAGDVLVPAGSQCTDNTSCGETNAAYKNIVNDIAVDPKNPKHVVAALGWRSGDTYNGFYETKDYTKGPESWHRLNVVLGAIKDSSDIGATSFAFSAKGDRLYAMVQQPSKINGSSNLAGIYVSRTGSPLGPWTQIANHTQLLHSGSALDKNGYSVGVQAWYNQFLLVDPKNRDHVWAGLEEVFETKDMGVHWTTPSPYWNFYWPCWDMSDDKNTCPLAGHPDQHSVATNGTNVFFGNDGGVYRRPVNGTLNANKNATDLVSLNDGTLGALQYYSVSVGANTGKDLGDFANPGGSAVVSGGLQDNGVSNLFLGGETTMGSNFGGDGGDGAADPNDGCNQLQEYVYLNVKVTNNCAVNKGAMSEATATSRLLDPNDPNPRFIAPIDRDSKDSNAAIFGGQMVYVAKDVWKAQSSKDLETVYDLGEGHSSTAVAMGNGVAYAAWCGPCNNAGFTRGIATNASGKWTQLDMTGLPNRFVQGLYVDPADGKHAFAAINGFSRRFTEGPGAGVGHVFETTDGGASWKDISENFPDVPASTIKMLDDGALVVGTDLATLYRAPAATEWTVLGTGLPLTVVMDVEVGPDGNIYAATHGRGIWSIPIPS